MNSDRDPVLCKYTGAVHVVVRVQGLRAPLYPGCGIHVCSLVRHGCVEWGLVSTQDRHKYNTWQSLFSPGNTNYHTNLAVASVCICFVFPVQNKAWHLLHTYETDLWVYRSLHYSIVTSRVTGC